MLWHNEVSAWGDKMRTALVSVLLFIIPISLAWSQQPSPNPQEAFVGTWVLNPLKVTFPKGKEIESHWPKYFIDAVTLEGSYLAISTRRGPYENSSDYPLSPEDEVEAQWFYRCDGKIYKIPAGSVSCRTVDNVLEGSNQLYDNDVMFGRHQEHFWRIEVSADGAEMTISYYNDRARTKLRATVTYDRKR